MLIHRLLGLQPVKKQHFDKFSRFSGSTPGVPHIASILLYRMMHRIIPTVSFLLATGFFLLHATAAFAQEDPQEPALPDIAPREVEILGQLEISFPSLERQPLVGFNPPPRVVDVPEDRQPYAEDYKKASSNLLENPLARPEPPGVTSLTGRPPAGGELSAGAGRYLTRFFKGRAAVPLSDVGALFAKVDYTGSDGHHPFDSDQADYIRAPFETFEASAGAGFWRSFLSAGVEFDGFLDRYTLFARGLGEPERTAGHGGALVWLRTGENSTTSFDASLAYNSTEYQTDPLANNPESIPDDVLDRNDRRITASANLQVQLAGGTGVATVTHSSAGIDTDGFVGNSVSSTDIGGAYTFRYQNLYDITAGLRAMTYSINDDNISRLPGEDDLEADSSSDKSVYISPEFSIEFFPSHTIRLYAQNRPGIEETTLAGLFRQNPYLVPEPAVQPVINTIDAEAGADLSFGLARFGAHVGVQRSPNYLFFEHTSGFGYGVYARGLSVQRYESAQILYAGAAASVVLPAGLQLTLRGKLRDGQLTESETVIPYFSPITVQAMFSYSFANRRALIQMVTNYESARYRDRNESRKIGDFFDMDVSASYFFTPTIGLTARVENISAGYLERWDGYPIAPTVFTVGLGIHW